MTIKHTSYQHIHQPAPDLAGENHIDFVRNLARPTWLTIEGEDRTRRRAIVTLLHGNEPSGLKAIAEMIRAQVVPATDLGVFIASVDAALETPIFSHRYLPGDLDFNRCFGHHASNVPPHQDELATEILETLTKFAPEAVIDTHNTSGHSEAFAVAVTDHPQVRQVTEIFTRKLVVLDLTLGTLIEQDLGCPVVTVEFGGFLDPRADELAMTSLQNFIHRKHLFDNEPGPLQMLKHPLRLELSDNVALHYASSVQQTADITVMNTIDQLNFSHLQPGATIGWAEADGLKHLQVMSGDENLVETCFEVKDGFICTKIPMSIFMATTDPFVAETDCLLYLCRED